MLRYILQKVMSNSSTSVRRVARKTGIPNLYVIILVFINLNAQ